MADPLTNAEQAGVDRAARKFVRDLGGRVAVSARDDGTPVITVDMDARRADPDMAPLDAFVPAAAVERICRDLIADPEFGQFHPLGVVALDFWFHTKVAKTTRGCKTIGRAHLVNPLYRAITGWDGLVVINGPWWAGANENQRRAICYHELSHFDFNDDGALTTRGHELEAFIGEARHFGGWHYGIAEIAEQLSMFEGASE